MKNKLAEENKKVINKKIQLHKRMQGRLKNIIQTKLSLILEFEDVKREKEDELDLNKPLIVIFKDGSQEELYADAVGYLKDKATFVYDLSQMKQEIAKVMLDDLELVSYK